MARRLGDQPGGIVGLLAYIEQHRDAIKYDLMMAGLRLSDVGSPAFTWHDFKVFLTHAPRTSAVVRDELSPEVAEWTVLHDMMANIEYALAFLAWTKTKDSRTNQNIPTRRERPSKAITPSMALEPDDEDAPIHVMGGQGVEIEAMRALLGWDENDEPIREG